MLVEVGHVHPNGIDGQTVTQTRLTDDLNEDGSRVCAYIVGTDAQEVRNHLFDNPGMVTHLPGNTAILDAVQPIRGSIAGKPDWVSVQAEGRDDAEGEDFERFLSEFFGCARGKPEDVEDTHWTLHNGQVFAPGVAPSEGE